MRALKILDCTLRDGGYCNDWHFGRRNIKKIIHGLVDAGIDIIECGFLTNRVKYDPDRSKFTDIRQFAEFIPDDRRQKVFCAMINYGEYNPSEIPDYNSSLIEGLRVAFHKKDFRSYLFRSGYVQKRKKLY